MKKIFTLLLSVATLATSCDVIDDVADTLGFGDNTEYVGTLVVSSYGLDVYDPEEEVFTFQVDVESDSSVSIIMVDVKFNENMPAMTITLGDMDFDGTNISCEALTPTMAGAPLEAYPITDVVGTVTASTLKIEFVYTTYVEATDTYIPSTISFSGTVVE